jgi:hypothetical protein
MGLNQKQIASTKPPVVGQVWISQDARNYYRIDAVNGEQVQVQRLGYEFENGVRKGRADDTYYWPISTFKLKNFRVVATNPARFESWLNRVTG